MMNRIREEYVYGQRITLRALARAHGRDLEDIVERALIEDWAGARRAVQLARLGRDRRELASAKTRAATAARKLARICSTPQPPMPELFRTATTARHAAAVLCDAVANLRFTLTQA